MQIKNTTAFFQVDTMNRIIKTAVKFWQGCEKWNLPSLLLGLYISTVFMKKQ